MKNQAAKVHAFDFHLIHIGPQRFLHGGWRMWGRKKLLVLTKRNYFIIWHGSMYLPLYKILKEKKNQCIWSTSKSLMLCTYRETEGPVVFLDYQEMLVSDSQVPRYLLHILEQTGLFGKEAYRDRNMLVVDSDLLQRSLRERSFFCTLNRVNIFLCKPKIEILSLQWT